MYRLIPSIAVAAIIFTSGMSAYAAENIPKDVIITEIWSDVWNGKDDDGTSFPEASYKYHILTEWVNNNYGDDEYDWSDVSSLKYEYRDYYKDLTEEWDFEDDRSGNWQITTEDGMTYHFEYSNGQWAQIDQNGNTVAMFNAHSTIEDNEKSHSQDMPNDEIQKPGNADPNDIAEKAAAVAAEQQQARDGKLTTQAATEPQETAQSVTEDTKQSDNMISPIFYILIALAAVVIILTVLMIRKKKH